MKLRLRKAERFAWSGLQSWGGNSGASGVSSEMEIGFGPANNTQKSSGMTIAPAAR